jgi:uncharacterized membrane protein
MRRIALPFLFVALAAGAAVPTAAAEQLHANVVSWSPNDVRAGEPVSVVFWLYTVEGSSYPSDGRPAVSVEDVAVVIRGQGESRHFPATHLDRGRYSTAISFPTSGGYDLRVSHGVSSYGPAGEILLGKGAICVATDCVTPQPDQAREALGDGKSRLPLGSTSAVLLVALVAALSFAPARIGRQGRLGSPRTGPGAACSVRIRRRQLRPLGRTRSSVLGTPQYIVGQTAVVIAWIALNAVAVNLRWDPYPFILLNLAFSTQAAYAAPLILLAQTRQAERDRIAFDQAEAHREDVVRTMEEREAAIKRETDELKALLGANTELTRQDTELTQRIETLTRAIHERLSVD